MGSVTLGNTACDVVQGGRIVLLNQFETFAGSGQGAAASGVTIAITAASTPGAGAGTLLAATSSGVSSTDGTRYQYTYACPAAAPPGDYLVTWTGVVSGVTETYQQGLTVSAIQAGLPAPGVYAAEQQYRAWSGDNATPSQLVTTMLQRASEVLDHALVGAVYAVNASGMPTDGVVISAFSRACSAQCQFMLAENDPSGVKRQYSSTNVAGVSQSRVAAMTAMTFTPLAPHAAVILRTAGVLPSAALISW